MALVGRQWTVKLPSLAIHGGVRGWLANQSEWRRRHEPNVNGPVLSLLHLVVVYRTADEVHHAGVGAWTGRDGDESKPRNWGRFGDRWLLIDFDDCWERRRGIVSWLYWRWRDRVGRRWQALAAAQPIPES